MSEEPDDSDRNDKGHNRPPADRQSGEQPRGGQPQSGQPQGGQPQSGQPRGGQPQSGQPQGGQPQSGQPQGGQPQSGQPRGGQPQAGQPQSGQPQAGQPQRQPRGQPKEQPPGQARQRQPQAGQTQMNIDIDTNYLREWVVYFTALFGVGGAGVGVLWVLFDTVDASIFEIDAADSFGAAVSATASGSLAVSTVIIMMMVLSVAAIFSGAWLGRTLQEPDRESFVIAGGAVAAGGAVFFLLVSLLLPVGFDNLSINIGGLLINLVLTAIFVGAIAAGSAAVTRNLAPRDL